MSGPSGVSELLVQLDVTNEEKHLFREVLDAVPCMLALWGSDQRCLYANHAYERWFGVKSDALVGRTLEDLLGPIYPLNRPHIEAALRGEPQQFEREIPDPAGGPSRHSLANYLPKIVDGVVAGFYAHVTDVTPLKQAENELRRAKQQAEDASQHVNELRELLPVCAWCHRIRDDEGYWRTVDQYFAKRPDVQLTHGICTNCAEQMLGAQNDR